MVQCKAVGATLNMDYKHSGELEADGQDKAFWGQKNLISLGNLEGARKEEENGCFLGNRKCGKTDFMLMKKGVVLKGLSSSPLNAVARN